MHCSSLWSPMASGSRLSSVRSPEAEMPLAPLPPVLIEPIVRAALLEDLGRAGDITTDAIVPSDVRAKVSLNARQAGVVAGLDLALMTFRLIDPAITASVIRVDGSP